MTHSRLVVTKVTGVYRTVMLMTARTPISVRTNTRRVIRNPADGGVRGTERH